MVDEQARNALREAIACTLCPTSRPGETCDAECPFLPQADAVLALLPGHAPALLAMLGNVREGYECPNCSMTCHNEDDLRYCHPKSSSRCPGSTAWDGEIRPVFVVTLHPAGDTP